MKDLNLSPNPAYKQDAEGCEAAPYVCPVIGLEMTGNFRFVFLWTCGCVFSERALKYVNSNICHNVSIVPAITFRYYFSVKDNHNLEYHAFVS